MPSICQTADRTSFYWTLCIEFVRICSRKVTIRSSGVAINYTHTVYFVCRLAFTSSVLQIPTFFFCSDCEDCFAKNAVSQVLFYVYAFNYTLRYCLNSYILEIGPLPLLCIASYVEIKDNITIERIGFTYVANITISSQSVCCYRTFEFLGLLFLATSAY